MSTPDPSVVRRAVAEFKVKRPVRFEFLQPWKDVIEELRSKRASCGTIAEFLISYGIQASKTTIVNFCREVLNEPPKRRQRGRPQKREPFRSKESAAPEQVTGSPVAAVPQPNGKHLHLPDVEEPPTTQPRKRGPRIANIDLIED